MKQPKKFQKYYVILLRSTKLCKYLQVIFILLAIIFDTVSQKPF